ncbi:MAG: integrase core domain-containing protein [Actinomycetes bacterium]
MNAVSCVRIQDGPGIPEVPRTFHQTLRRWLTARPDAATLTDLQVHLAIFQHVYNHERPHRANDRRTPAETYEALPKDAPRIDLRGKSWRVRHDTVDTVGVITLRRRAR